MSTVRIQSSAYRMDQPDQTTVVAAVCTPIGGVTKTDLYELVVPGRYESITDELQAAATEALVAAGVLPSTQPPNNET
jgi:hypothetical protein